MYGVHCLCTFLIKRYVVVLYICMEWIPMYTCTTLYCEEITQDILAMEASLTDRLTKTWAVNLGRWGILK